MAQRNWTKEEYAKLDIMVHKGLKIREIAEELGRTTSSVSNAMHRQRYAPRQAKRVGKVAVKDAFKNRRPSAGRGYNAEDVCPRCKRAPTRGRVCWHCATVDAHLKALRGDGT